jgi:hypothetical protein
MSLKAKGDLIASTADRISAAFARELGRVLRDTERALQPMLRAALDGDRTAVVAGARGLALRQALRQSLRNAGYDALVDRATSEAVESMAGAVLSSRLAKSASALVKPNPLKLLALGDIGRANLLEVGDELAAALWRSLAAWVFSVRPSSEIVEDLGDVFEEELPHLQTLFDTQVSMFGRQVEALATAELDADQPFLYVGPDDEVARPFCKEHVGKVYTREVIDAMDNGQLPNVFITAGGYNCRHSFIAVESQELRDLANTDKRAPEFERQAVAA